MRHVNLRYSVDNSDVMRSDVDRYVDYHSMSHTSYIVIRYVLDENDYDSRFSVTN